MTIAVSSIAVDGDKRLEGCVMVWRCMKFFMFLVVCGSLIAAIGCETTSTIESDGSSLKIFRLAQDAYTDTNYELARRYYRIIVDSGRYTKQHVIAARYELAYIDYKTDDLQRGYDEFNALIAEYYIDNTDFPQWILILSEKMVAIIGDRLATATTQVQ